MFLFICGDVYTISMNNDSFSASQLLSCSVESTQQNYHLYGVFPNSNLLCSVQPAGTYYANAVFAGSTPYFSERMVFFIALGKKKKFWQGQYLLLSSRVIPCPSITKKLKQVTSHWLYRYVLIASCEWRHWTPTCRQNKTLAVGMKKTLQR